jgi:hypothetical protein
VRANKVRYAQAEASARSRNPARPPYFNIPMPMGMVDAEGAEYVVGHVIGSDIALEMTKAR